VVGVLGPTLIGGSPPLGEPMLAKLVQIISLKVGDRPDLLRSFICSIHIHRWAGGVWWEALCLWEVWGLTLERGLK